MKRLKGMALILVCAFVLSGLGVIASADKVTAGIALDSVKVMVNGKAVQETNVLYEDRTYVPLRAVFETLGCLVEWDGDTQTASITGEIKASQDLVKAFTTYEEEYEALKYRYDLLIADQQQKGKEEEAARLEQEFIDKVAALQAKYEAKNQQSGPAPELQMHEIELNVIKVVVNGTAINEENILFNSRTFVPLRAISEFIGCEVDWVESTRTAFITGELVQKNQYEDVYTSFNEEYARLKIEYDKLIAEQIALGDQAYKDFMKQSSAATGGQAGSQTQIAEAERAPFLKRAEELRQEFDRHVARLKVKYEVTE